MVLYTLLSWPQALGNVWANRRVTCHLPTTLPREMRDSFWFPFRIPPNHKGRLKPRLLNWMSEPSPLTRELLVGQWFLMGGLSRLSWLQSVRRCLPTPSAATRPSAPAKKRRRRDGLKIWLSCLDCCWVRSLDFNFLGNQAVFHNPKKVYLFAGGSTATKLQGSPNGNADGPRSQVQLVGPVVGLCPCQLVNICWLGWEHW